MRRWIMAGVLLLVVLTSCDTAQPGTTNEAPQTQTTPASQPEASVAAQTQATETVQEVTTETATGQTLRLATTTSTADSGLLDAILPEFERQDQANVEVIAVGTGQALKLGENGDVDVVLVHARKREDEFVAQGFGINRRDVMYNDFIIVGPSADPAKLGSAQDAAAAFKQIADAQATFASRGDDSGTFTKEQSLWTAAGINPEGQDWYKSLGQGMGETLITANEQGGYTLSDRATFLSMRDKLPALAISFGGETIEANPDKTLRNPYGVIQVNPEKHPGVNAELAATFVEWLTSPPIQDLIGAFGQDTYGQPLFFPQANSQ